MYFTLYPVVLSAGHYTEETWERIYFTVQFPDKSLYAFQFASVSAIDKILGK